jgi:hypothetical protein
MTCISYQNIRVIRIMNWLGRVACVGERRGAHRVLVGTPEGKRPFRSPRRRWENNIKMDLEKKTVRGRVLTHLAKDRVRLRAVANAVMNPRVPYNAMKFVPA